ncbi:hypothetical protein AAY473_018905, partial [Plecturocebus cupreus]
MPDISDGEEAANHIAMLECNGMISAHCSLRLLGSSYSASASLVAGITEVKAMKYTPVTDGTLVMARSRAQRQQRELLWQHHASVEQADESNAQLL